MSPISIKVYSHLIHIAAVANGLVPLLVIHHSLPLLHCNLRQFFRGNDQAKIQVFYFSGSAKYQSLLAG